MVKMVNQDFRLRTRDREAGRAMKPDAKWNNRVERYRRESGPEGRGSSSHYIWRVPPDYLSRTRPDHRRLDGQTFSWNDPPVVDSKTGQRGHPGMDKYCRCYAEPLRGPK